MTSYLGSTPGGGLTRHATGCADLRIDIGPRQFPGEPLSIRLENFGSDMPGILIGLFAPTRALCGTCRFAIGQNGPLVHLANTAVAAVPIPPYPHLIGARFADTGYAYGSGPCHGPRLADTFEVVLR